MARRLGRAAAGSRQHRLYRGAMQYLHHFSVAEELLCNEGVHALGRADRRGVDGDHRGAVQCAAQTLRTDGGYLGQEQKRGCENGPHSREDRRLWVVRFATEYSPTRVRGSRCVDFLRYCNRAAARRTRPVDNDYEERRGLPLPPLRTCLTSGGGSSSGCLVGVRLLQPSKIGPLSVFIHQETW